MSTKSGAGHYLLPTICSAVLFSAVLASGDQNSTVRAAEITTGSNVVTQPAAAVTPERALQSTAFSYRKDLALLKAIGQSGKYASQARSKEDDGRLVQVSTEPVNLELSEAYLDEIQNNLDILSTDELPTYALLHHIDQSGSLSAWLLAPDGGIVHGNSGETYTDLGGLNDGLGVTRMAAFRGPRAKGEPPMSEAEQEAIREVDRSPESVAKRSESLAQIAKQLLPGAVGEALGIPKWPPSDHCCERYRFRSLCSLTAEQRHGGRKLVVCCCAGYRDAS